MQHDLAIHLPDLARFGSTAELESSPLYERLRPQIDDILETVVHESHRRSEPTARSFLRATAWNIERGTKLEGILATLGQHRDISDSDVFLLTELDHGMARSGNRAVARELAEALELEYAFAPSYMSLVKGSGVEVDVEGENTLALHGNAVFSRWPIRSAVSIALPNGIDKMRGKEKRLGCQRAVLVTIEHASGPIHLVSAHLDCHSKRSHRRHQMRLILDQVDARGEHIPAVIGGDWNTSTYNSHRASRAILGFWRRVLMGVDNVVRNHYPHPDRMFERALFRDLEQRGYRYRDVNDLGACTFHYDITDDALNRNLGDWIPGWCFPFIRWALGQVGGSCGLKLDWFAVRGLSPANDSAPRVLPEVHSTERLSDHDPIVVDLARS